MDIRAAERALGRALDDGLKMMVLMLKDCEGYMRSERSCGQDWVLFPDMFDWSIVDLMELVPFKFSVGGFLRW